MKHHFTRQDTPDGFAVVTFVKQDGDVNVLSEDVIREFDMVLDTLKSDSSVKGVVFMSGRDDHFIYGADIKTIQSLKTVEDVRNGCEALQAIFQKIPDLSVPTVAAINGACLGGGLELALACTWRIATDARETKLALPEIQLGLIPGAGGTQRLPRLIGIQSSLDMILTGKRLDGRRALKSGLVDACVPKHLLRSEALKFAAKRRETGGLSSLAKGKLPHIDFAKLALEENPVGRRIMSKQAKDMITKKTKGFYPASYKALEAVFDGYERSLAKGLKLEAQLFAECAMTSESKSLIHLFHVTSALKKHPSKAAAEKKFGPRPVETVGVVGAGFMGAGIALVCAEKGIRARFSDPSRESNAKALQAAAKYFQKKVERRRMKPFEMASKLTHISPGLSPQGFDQADVVIEAVFEDMNLKRRILAQIESSMRDDAVFASNTSALPISEIAAESKRKDRILGMHFFSPVEKMPLLEIVTTPETADWATGRAVDLGQELGKQVIVVKDSPGFYTTRALAFFLAESAQLLMEGIEIEKIDKALTDFGFPVGPITLIDEVGIDVGIHVLETMEKSYPDRIKSPAGLTGVAASGRLGRKNNKGFYQYENGKKGDPDTSIYSLINPEKTHKLSPADIVDRPLMLFINESVRCLEEGVISCPGDGDVGAVFGLGFPPFWGGPFKYIDHIGAKNIRDRMLELGERFGKRFTPSDMLNEYAKTNRLFFPEE